MKIRLHSTTNFNEDSTTFNQLAISQYLTTDSNNQAYKISIFTQMEEQAGDFKEMLNTMKAVEFRQKQDEKKMKLIFTSFKRKTEPNYHPHYKMTLYCKVIKGFMINSMQLQEFADRLENLYIDMLLRQHFSAIHQFKSMAEEERLIKQRQIEINIKRNGLRRFRCRATKEIELRRSQQAAKHQFSRVEEFKYKTDLNFFAKKDPQSIITKQTGFNNRVLQDSIRSRHWQSSAKSQFQGKRKFAAVKQLPKMKELQSLIQKQKMVDTNSKQSKPIKHITTQRQSLKNKQEQINQNQQNVLASQSKQQVQLQSTRKVTYDKDKIIALICEVKMLEIVQIKSIIEDYRAVFKQQAMISQQQHLSESKATLQTIINL